MAILVATTVAFVIWVVLWSLGIKALDGIILALAIVIIAATTRMVARYLPGRDEV
ncbi:MAG: hypothetical protein QOJ97_1643 [Solirubrobacteraceae bacterium]|jgi:hypothetical protein|nr:hypothetical protein [Solirubrobacteraceae bacterium]